MGISYKGNLEHSTNGESGTTDAGLENRRRPRKNGSPVRRAAWLQWKTKTRVQIKEEERKWKTKKKRSQDARYERLLTWKRTKTQNSSSEAV